jgi:RNA polymerase sigma factor (sigma-70 family)
MMSDDMDLIRAYATSQSELAFATLVARHVNLVYSAALRQVRDPQLAGEITQTVFILLTRKAAKLSPQTVLSGWLYRTARFVAKAAQKREFRRQFYEQEAHMQAVNDITHNDSVWEEWPPLLDEAMAQLRDKDRDALVLRYFENRSLKEVGNILGVEERAAQKRVARGLDKLRVYFGKRGIILTTAIILSNLSANSVQAAPATLAQSVSAVALAKGAAGSGSTLTLIKGALKLMAWTKVKMAAAVGVGVLLVAMTVTVVVEKANLIQGRTESEWIKSIVYNGDDNQRHLWQSFGPRGVRMLVRGLNPAKYDRQTRMGAANMLDELEDYAGENGYHADPGVIPDLIRALKAEKDDGVRGCELGCFEIPIQTMPENEKAGLFPELVRGLDSRDESVRNNSLVALQYYPNQSATVVPLLVKSLQDPAAYVRLHAVGALNKMDPQTAAQSDVFTVLLGCLNDPNTANDAVIQLGEWRRDPARSVPALIQSLENGDVYIRQNAAVALGRFGGNAIAALPALQRALADTDRNVSREAAAALKRINTGATAR